MFRMADREKAGKFREEELPEESRAEGRNEGRMTAIRNRTETMKRSAGQTMDALRIPDADRTAYAGMLQPDRLACPK